MRFGIAWVAALRLALAVQIPSGTQVQIRLISAVNTTTAQVDQRFEAMVIAPVVAGGQIAMSAGVKVGGHIKEVKAALKPDDQAVLVLAFDQASDARGRKVPIAARLAGVDNARESVDKDGRVLG